MKNEVWAMQNPESGVLEINSSKLQGVQHPQSLERQTWTYITPNASEAVGQHERLWGGDGTSGACSVDGGGCGSDGGGE